MPVKLSRLPVKHSWLPVKLSRLPVKLSWLPVKHSWLPVKHSCLWVKHSRLWVKHLRLWRPSPAANAHPFPASNHRFPESFPTSLRLRAFAREKLHRFATTDTHYEEQEVQEGPCDAPFAIEPHHFSATAHPAANSVDSVRGSFHCGLPRHATHGENFRPPSCLRVFVVKTPARAAATRNPVHPTNSENPVSLFGQDSQDLQD